VALAGTPINKNVGRKPGQIRKSRRAVAQRARIQGSTTDVSQQDINVLALVKGSERYIFLFDDSSRAETLRVLGRYASNPELSFSWYDAAVLSQKIRQQTAKPATKHRRFDVPLAPDVDDRAG
jgi:hypothetical protein